MSVDLTNMHPAYILSGGRSSRFGSDKSRYSTPQGPQLLVLADHLRSCGHQVHFVADTVDRYADLGITCLLDVQPNSGPLAGLAGALQHRNTLCSSDRNDGWLLLVSCDQQHWQHAWYEDLHAHIHEGIEASVYFDNQWQPLPALYHCDLLPHIMQRLAQRQLSLHGLLDGLGSRVAKVTTAQPPSRWSFNTLSDLNRRPEHD